MSDQFLGVNHVTKKNINSLYIDKLRKYIDFLNIAIKITMQDDNIDTIRELNRSVSKIDFTQNDASITKDVNIVIQNIKQEYNDVFSVLVLSPFYEDDDNIKKLKGFLVDDLDYTKRTNNFTNFNTGLNLLLNERAEEQAEAERVRKAEEAERHAEGVRSAREILTQQNKEDEEKIRRKMKSQPNKPTTIFQSAFRIPNVDNIPEGVFPTNINIEDVSPAEGMPISEQYFNTSRGEIQRLDIPYHPPSLNVTATEADTDDRHINYYATSIPDADVAVLDPRPQTTRFGKIKRGLAQIPGVKKVLGITGTTTKHSDNAYTSKNPKKGWLWGGTRRKSKKARKARKSKKSRKSKKTRKSKKSKKSQKTRQRRS